MIGVIFYLLIIGVIQCIWGYAVYSIVQNKGYDENWFWWGFFFGILALLFALAKEDVSWYYRESGSRLSAIAAEAADERTLASGGWVCSDCGKVQPSYTGTCGCGNTKNRSKAKKEAAEQKKKAEDTAFVENEIIETIKRYKELLDAGALTAEEFEKKKSELLSK